ncbi:MAG: cold-shock protein, partial [Runella zeae]
FTKQGEVASENTSEVSPDTDLTGDHRKESYILSLKEGFGFIKYPPNNVFFHYTSLRDYDFNDLLIGDRVQFTLDEKEGGRAVGYDVVVLQ